MRVLNQRGCVLGGGRRGDEAENSRKPEGLRVLLRAAEPRPGLESLLGERS